MRTTRAVDMWKRVTTDGDGKDQQQPDTQSSAEMAKLESERRELSKELFQIKQRLASEREKADQQAAQQSSVLTRSLQRTRTEQQTLRITVATLRNQVESVLKTYKQDLPPAAFAALTLALTAPPPSPSVAGNMGNTRPLALV